MTKSFCLLGAEASAFRKSNEGSSGVGNGDGLFSLAPILDVYNDVYQVIYFIDVFTLDDGLTIDLLYLYRRIIRG